MDNNVKIGQVLEFHVAFLNETPPNFSDEINNRMSKISCTFASRKQKNVM
jgi:hypothetical protein